MRRITIDLDPEALEKLDAIRKEYCLTFLSEAAKIAIVFAYRSQFEGGSSSVRSKAGRPAHSDEEIKKARTPEEKRKIRDEGRKEELIKIATAAYPDGLAGVVSEDKKTVTYHTYFERGRDERTLLLREINVDLIASQYQPSYEEITRMQREGKVDYPVK